MKYRKYYSVIVLLLVIINMGLAQDNSFSKFTTSLEIGGSSGAYSISEEYLFLNNEKYSMNLKIGFGYLPIEGTGFTVIPAGVNILVGKRKHHLEGGLGISFIKGLTYQLLQVPLNYNTKYFADQALYFVPSLGYRFDKLKSGFVFKVHYSPLIVILDLLNKDEIAEKVTEDVIVLGDTTTKRDWFEHFYGEDSYPEAASKYGYFGISIGYRF